MTVQSNRSALLVMDYQANIITRLGDAAAPLIERTKTAIVAARKAQLPIVYVVVGFRPGYPELHPRNAMFAMAAQTGLFTTTSPGSDIVPALAPEPGDVVILKHRVGAFLGTDLDMVLRAKDIDTLVYAGIATSGVVLSTLRYATDSDYRGIVLEDCCADADEEVHRVLMDKVFIRQATVTTASEWITTILQ